MKESISLKDAQNRASLVAQWKRIRLPTQEMQIRSMVWEDPIAMEQLRLRATTIKPVLYSLGAAITEACAL